MSEFPELKEALRAWAHGAAASLIDDPNARYVGRDLPQWGCDSDGIFRDIVRPVDGWDYRYLEKLKYLASWPRVEKAFQDDDRLSRQINTLVGTAQGGMRVETFGLAVHILPHPYELDRVDEIFEDHYAQLEGYLMAEELAFKAIWPVPGLIADTVPLELEYSLELDVMSDSELSVALRTGIILPAFAGSKLFQAGPADRTCFRYRYSLGKMVGSHDEVSAARFQELDKRLQGIQAAIAESLALILPEPVMAAGRFAISNERWSPTSSGVAFQRATMPLGSRMRRVAVDPQFTSDLQQVWQHVSRRDLLERHKGLALALRRLSYQAQRERSDDELLDIMIAAEALYLIGLGNESYRGELRYRLALRAALWAEESQFGLTKREILKLMQSAYDARSAIAHGGSPDAKIMKIQGQRVELPELVKKTRAIVSAGCRRALGEAAASSADWPPDWDALVLEGR
jgi:Apea-like HEPN